jgi:hypothetical protein
MFAEGMGKGFRPSDSAALPNSEPTNVVFMGGFGYSLERGPSNGLPPGWIRPPRFPALPPIP